MRMRHFFGSMFFCFVSLLYLCSKNIEFGRLMPYWLLMESLNLNDFVDYQISEA